MDYLACFNSYLEIFFPLLLISSLIDFGQGTRSGGQRQEEGDRVGGHLRDKHSGRGTR